MNAKARGSFNRIYSVGIGSPSPYPSPPRRGEARRQRWNQSLISEGPAGLESVSLSTGVRASVTN